MAAETLAALPFLGSRLGVKGVAAPGHLRSAETDLLGTNEGAGAEFLETKGEGYLLEENEDEATEHELEVEAEVEGDMYLEDTILDLGFLGLLEIPLLLSFSEGNNGGLPPCSSREAAVVLGFFGSVVEAAPETAATIITIKDTHTHAHADYVKSQPSHIEPRRKKQTYREPFWHLHSHLQQRSRNPTVAEECIMGLQKTPHFFSNLLFFFFFVCHTPQYSSPDN